MQSNANTLVSVPQFAPPAWVRSAKLYAINVRQYTAQGTLLALLPELPRLHAMGVNTLWFMPIQPIGAVNRKGRLGSYYAIADYTAVNPEFGTLQDFKTVVRAAQALGLKVVLDWVANHTAWDHPWVTQHPQRYKKDAHGQIHAVTFDAGPGNPPEYWTDVVGLDYAEPTLWPAMTEAMAFWLRETGLDGFRCDVAALVPLPFWHQARSALQAVAGKPLFMLAEATEPELHAAFDATYDWALYQLLRRIAQGEQPYPAAALRAWWQDRQARYPAQALGLNYTANHDSNSWHGSCAELYGSPAAFKAMALLAALLPGMPLVYGGQESYFEKRLQFFERDPIDWRGKPLQAFYAELLAPRSHPATPECQGTEHKLEWLETANPMVVGFSRMHSGKRISVWVNLSCDAQLATTPGQAGHRLDAWAWQQG